MVYSEFILPARRRNNNNNGRTLAKQYFPLRRRTTFGKKNKGIIYKTPTTAAAKQYFPLQRKENGISHTTLAKEYLRHLRSCKNPPAAKGILLFSLIPKKNRTSTMVQSDTLVCASEATWDGELFSRKLGDGGLILKNVRLDQQVPRGSISLHKSVKKGDVIIIEHSHHRVRNAQQVYALPFGFWKIMWTNGQLRVIPWLSV